MTDHSTALRMAAAALALVALPGAAPATSSRPGAATAQSRSSATAPTAAKAKRYCVVQAVTGSRIPLKVCNIREDWLKQGFDPLAPERP